MVVTGKRFLLFGTKQTGMDGRVLIRIVASQGNESNEDKAQNHTWTQPKWWCQVLEYVFSGTPYNDNCLFGLNHKKGVASSTGTPMLALF